MKRNFFPEMCLSVKVQDNGGVSAPFDNDSVLFATDINVDVMTGETEEVNIPMLGGNARSRPVMNRDPQTTFSFKMGMNTPLPGVRPPWLVLPRACGMDVIEHDTFWELGLSAIDDIDAVTARLFRPYDETGNHQYEAFDASGNISFDFEVGKAPQITVNNLTGTYVRPDVTARIEPNYDQVYDTISAPLDSTQFNEVRLGTTALCLQSLSIPDADGRELKRDKFSCGNVNIGSQKPIRPKIVIMNTDWLTEKNVYEAAEAITSVPIDDFVCDMDLMRVQMDKVQPMNPKAISLGNAGFLGLELELNCLVPPKYYVNKVA